jgi:lipooligosaccharide transport system ATP-binding protein
MSSVYKVYGPRRALEDFNLVIERPECVALLGPNGAGKTTALHVLCGFVRPTGGKVYILGVDLEQNPRLAKASLGVAPQADSLDIELGVLENLITYASYYGIPRKQALTSALEWLEFLGLKPYAKEPIGALSGGMRRRLLIARALVHNPKVLILDEPTTGLDPFSRRDVWEAVSRIKALGVCILLTTHYLEEANILADRAIILDKGRKIAEGSPGTLVTHYTGELVIELVAPKGRIKELFDGVPLPKGQKEIVADTLRLYLKEGLKDGLKGWLEGLESVRVFKREPTLEDVYFKLLGNGQEKVL